MCEHARSRLCMYGVCEASGGGGCFWGWCYCAAGWGGGGVPGEVRDRGRGGGSFLNVCFALLLFLLVIGSRCVDFWKFTRLKPSESLCALCKPVHSLHCHFNRQLHTILGDSIAMDLRSAAALTTLFVVADVVVVLNDTAMCLSKTCWCVRLYIMSACMTKMCPCVWLNNIYEHDENMPICITRSCPCAWPNFVYVYDQIMAMCTTVKYIYDPILHFPSTYLSLCVSRGFSMCP